MAADLVISEFLASNSGGLQDGDGDSPDWIEVFNAGDTVADLGGYYLTDDSADLTKWAFPAGTTIDPRSLLVVFASDKGIDGPAGELHTGYKLSAGGEYLGLIEPDGQTVVHHFSPEFPPQETNISYGLSMASSAQTLVDNSTSMSYWVPSSGAFDSTWTDLAFNDSGWSVSTPGLGYELSSGNGSFTSLIDASVPSGTTSAYARLKFDIVDVSEINTLSLEMLYDDGFVAYLNGEKIADANAPSSPAWNSVAGPISRPDETVLDEYVRYDVAAFIDSLNVGENVLAIHALNLSNSADMLMVPRLVSGGAQLVEPREEGYFSEPTPGMVNPVSLLGIVADTKFSIDRGFYDDPFDVEITTETEGATIVYTTDGSEPAVDGALTIVNGSVYSGAIPITGTTNLRAAAFKLGHAPTNVDTQTYLFTGDIISQTYQTAIDAGLPSSWGTRGADYGLDPDVIGPGDLFQGQYVPLIEDSLKAIPTISLTLDSADFFGGNGIYTNVLGRGVDWERATSAELIFPDGSDGFQVDAGLRIHGAASRFLSKKNALRLLFKSEYGAAKLDYPLFGDAGVDEFDTIVLRPHFNDGWGWSGAQDDPLFIRDQWFRDSQAAMGHASSRGNVMHLYINGWYWGLYNPSERPDVSFAAETFGGEKEEYDAVNHNGLHGGNMAAYNQMIAISEDVENGASQAIKNEAYQRIQGKLPDGSDDPTEEIWLDMTNYIDYIILNHYGGNDDWPNRNWFSNRRRGPESEGYRFFSWDSEISLALSSRTDINESYMDVSSGAAEAYDNLRESDEFRIAFADRIHKHLFNGGALYVNPASPTYDPEFPQDNVPASRFANLSDTVFDAMVAESARWGDQHVATPRTRNIDWQQELDYMLGPYFRDRHNIVLDQWRAADLYPTIHAPELLIDGNWQHGGVIESGSLLSIDNSNPPPEVGVVYYTTDGSDPRLIGGAVNAASASTFASDVSLESTTLIKARVNYNGDWSALTEAAFIVPDADFDQNGVVSGADFLAWQQGFGISTATTAGGDADSDGDVDSNDLVHWQSQYGSSTAPSIASTVGALTQPDGELVMNNSTDTGSLLAPLPLSVGAAGVLQTVGSVNQAMNLARQGKMPLDESEVLIQRQAAEQLNETVTPNTGSTTETGIARPSTFTDRRASDDVFAAWAEGTLQGLAFFPFL